MGGIAANADSTSRVRHRNAKTMDDLIVFILSSSTVGNGAGTSLGGMSRGDVLKPILCGGTVSNAAADNSLNHVNGTDELRLGSLVG